MCINRLKRCTTCTHSCQKAACKTQNLTPRRGTGKRSHWHGETVTMTRGFTHTLWIGTQVHTRPITFTSQVHTPPLTNVLTLLTLRGRTSMNRPPEGGRDRTPRQALRVLSKDRASPGPQGASQQPFDQARSQNSRIAPCLRHRVQSPSPPLPPLPPVTWPNPPR